MNRSEEFFLRLSSNAIPKYSHNNKRNSYKILLPASLDLGGTCEVPIGKIQYDFNWPNFNEEFVAYMISVKESEGERERRERNSQEKDILLLHILKFNEDSLVCNTHWIPTPKNSMIMGMSMKYKLDGGLPGER